MIIEFQTRTESGEVKFHSSLNDALDYADKCIKTDPVWKISFTIETGETIRLIRSEHGWILNDVLGGFNNHNQLYTRFKGEAK